ncbi:hypothetical protein HAX54_035127 [Datura stramonium]|uniref:RING-type E3 ubiquitin transferase n=1 Tax=Datura stramonium TaxID=4076 RepID=A0ABS8VGC8_DATST|nr:hypothetical protein [Datura stramonium]
MASVSEYSVRIIRITNRSLGADYEVLDRRQENNYLEEKEEDSILGYFKTRTHCVVALEDRVNNPTKSDEEICAICQVEFEHEETIETLGCGHEYHTCAALNSGC